MTLRSGELADLAGVNVETLRYYERRGLIDPPSRTLGGHRTYDDDAVALIGVIKAAQRLGFTLDEVAELLESGRRAHPTAQLRDRAVSKLAEVDQKMADLATIRNSLQQVINAQCDSLSGCTCADCPVPFADITHGGIR